MSSGLSRFGLLCTFLFLYNMSISQTEKVLNGYILKEFQNVDWQSNSTSEFYAFDKVFQDFDILVLAESDHGHGSSMDAQSKILKHLIDSSKIKSLYIESSWLNCEKIYSVLKEKGVDGIKEAQKYMTTYELKYWVKNGFWNYLAKKIIKGELTLHGFDIDGVSPLIVEELYEEASRLATVSEYASLNQQKFKEVKVYFESFGSLTSQSRINEESYYKIQELVDKIVTEYKKQGNQFRVRQWKSILHLFLWMNKRGQVLENNKYSNQINSLKQQTGFYKVRDSLMAVNFLEIYSTDKGAKVACSMSAYHALKNSMVVEDLSNCCKAEDVRTMQEIISRTLGAKTYSICFVSAEGEYGVQSVMSKKVLNVKKPVRHSLEYRLYKKGYSYCLVDLNKLNIQNNPFFMNVVFDKYLKSNWQQNFSAAFFIRKMRPLVLIE